MSVPPPLVLGVTGSFHGITLFLFTIIGYFSYKIYNDYNDHLYQDIGWDICLMILGIIILIWLMTILVRADRTLRRIHDDFSCVIYIDIYFVNFMHLYINRRKIWI